VRSWPTTGELDAAAQDVVHGLRNADQFTRFRANMETEKLSVSSGFGIGRDLRADRESASVMATTEAASPDDAFLDQLTRGLRSAREVDDHQNEQDDDEDPDQSIARSGECEQHGCPPSVVHGGDSESWCPVVGARKPSIIARTPISPRRRTT